ncbi:RNA-splicing factor [Coemansia spiralis]|uniref:RNA-splicing factor n=1 Tax=Coemansia spiralis TaxID=417178 RepID=A0A9W8GPG2_9FUNG|nr:RNA-splicing factor [Coemansia spiralis]
MGSGDLNMKKSWHPLTQANKNRVAKEKQKAEEESQRTARIQKELREERQKEEMDMLNASITKKPINKLDWMYSAPSTASQNTEDLEAYLLGKKNISTIIDSKDEPPKDQEKWKAGGLFAFSNRNANSERDAKAKDLEDPLMDIKRREQAAIQAMMKNSAGRKDTGDEKPKREKRKSKDGRDDDKTRKERKRREHRREEGSREREKEASDRQHRAHHSSKRRREHSRDEAKESHRSRSGRSRSPVRRSRH